MSEEKAKPEIKDQFNYVAVSPGLLRVEHEIGYKLTISQEYDFQTRQITSITRDFFNGNAAIGMLRQNFRDIERQEAIDEMRLKLIELGGDPDRFETSTDGRNKRPLGPQKN